VKSLDIDNKGEILFKSDVLKLTFILKKSSAKLCNFGLNFSTKQSSFSSTEKSNVTGNNLNSHWRTLYTRVEVKLTLRDLTRPNGIMF
jgi:hypothetical protein